MFILSYLHSFLYLYIQKAILNLIGVSKLLTIIYNKFDTPIILLILKF